MSVSINNPGVSGITIETDPTALKLTGGTLTGRVVFPNRTSGGIAHLNLGTVADNLTQPSSLVEGDIYFTDSDTSVGWNTRLNYNGKAFGGTVTQYSLAVLQNTNFFTQPQTISCNTTATQSALRVTNTGSGYSILVEDSTNPDSTPFVVTGAGQAVFGGLTPYSTYTLTVNGGASIESGSYYVRVNSSGVNLYGQLVLTNQTTVSGTVNFNDYNNDLAVTVNGQTIFIPYRT